MEALVDNQVIKFHPDTLQVVRKMFGLDQPGAMSDAIDILQEWIKKQDHFLKKDFDRDYLERVILKAKGSIERAKQRLENLCTARTMLPKFFVNCNVKDLNLNVVYDVLCTKLTQDYYRVYLLKNFGQKFDADFCTQYFIRLVYHIEYELKVDYSAGVVIILDFRQANLVAHMKTINFAEVHQAFAVIMESYGYRIKGIHMLSTSKLIDTLVVLFKRTFSAKIGGRIHVHSTLESLHEHVEKDVLPKDYGGKDMLLRELSDIYQDILSSKDHMEYMKIMNAAGTDESCRSAESRNDQFSGMPGSFRSLQVD